jgi:hypothetical protein
MMIHHIILFSLVLLIINLSNTSHISSKNAKSEILLKKRRTNKEFNAVLQAKAMKERYFNLSDSFLATRKPFLIGTFINATKPISKSLLHSNIAKMRGIADFAIIVYDGDSSDIADLCYANKEQVSAIVHCRRALISYVPGYRVIPKPLLYNELIHYLPNYRKTMLIDEDISLQSFNYSEFMSIWDCAFYSIVPHPPLVVQGLIAQKTQFYNFVHYRTWKESSNLSHVIAAETDFIEQQIPVFDSFFLLWFIEHVMSYTYMDSLVLESDWGSDGYWCAAAVPFAHHVYDVKNVSTYIPCALIIGTSPFHHMNTHSLSTKKGTFGKYVQTGRKISGIWKQLFPSWKSFTTDPTWEVSGSRMSSGLNKSCPLKYGPIK